MFFGQVSRPSLLQTPPSRWAPASTLIKSKSEKTVIRKHMALKSYLTLNFKCSDKKRKLLYYRPAHFEKNIHLAADWKQRGLLNVFFLKQTDETKWKKFVFSG